MTDTIDPVELSSIPPAGPSREQTRKTVYDKYPGHISIANDRVHISGCRMIRFLDSGDVSGLSADDSDKFFEENEHDMPGTAETAMNAYFSTRANLLVVQATPMSDGSIVVLFTTQLDEEDLEEFTEIQRRVNLEMREWRDKRAEERRKAGEADTSTAAVMKAGKAAIEHNLFKKLRDLEEEVATLKDALAAKEQ